MSDAKYFSSRSKHEVDDFIIALNSNDISKKIEAMKAVNTHLTIGKDVQDQKLFDEVVRNFETSNIELKKLFFAYMIQLAPINPQLVLTAVAALAEDTSHSSPFIRSLALRTLGYINDKGVMEHLSEPLEECLSDENPFVRKTACLVCMRIAQIDPTKGDIMTARLKEMLKDDNAIVIASAAEGIVRIRSDWVPTKQFATLIIQALEECSEWGQVVLLESVSRYFHQISSMSEAEDVATRISSRLQHRNSSVVLKTCQALGVLLKKFNLKAKDDLLSQMAAALVTFLSGSHEIAFVALKSIKLLQQTFPGFISRYLRLFLTSFKEPFYLKAAKLECLSLMADNNVYQKVLLEFEQAASSVDRTFANIAINCIGKVALQDELFCDFAVNLLLNLVRDNQSVFTAILRNCTLILRRYPGKYDALIGALFESAFDVEWDTECKTLIAWIAGEYGGLITEIDEILEFLTDGFDLDSPTLQLEILTAVVKNFLRFPHLQPLCQDIITRSTNQIDLNLRDKAFFYWRLIAESTEIAKKVVLAYKPIIKVSDAHVAPLISRLGCVSTVTESIRVAQSIKLEEKVCIVREPRVVYEERGATISAIISREERTVTIELTLNGLPIVQLNSCKLNSNPFGLQIDKVELGKTTVVTLVGGGDRKFHEDPRMNGNLQMALVFEKGNVFFTVPVWLFDVFWEEKITQSEFAGRWSSLGVEKTVFLSGIDKSFVKKLQSNSFYKIFARDDLAWFYGGVSDELSVAAEFQFKGQMARVVVKCQNAIMLTHFLNHLCLLTNCRPISETVFHSDEPESPKPVAAPRPSATPVSPVVSSPVVKNVAPVIYPTAEPAATSQKKKSSPMDLLDML
ncbi:hypothetical protein PCE1_004984 [Barthelona sp. PCE]